MEGDDPLLPILAAAGSRESSENNRKAMEFMATTPRVLSPDEWLRAFCDFILQVGALIASRGVNGRALRLPLSHPTRPHPLTPSPSHNRARARATWRTSRRWCTWSRGRRRRTTPSLCTRRMWCVP